MRLGSGKAYSFPATCQPELHPWSPPLSPSGPSWYLLLPRPKSAAPTRPRSGCSCRDLAWFLRIWSLEEGASWLRGVFEICHCPQPPCCLLQMAGFPSLWVPKRDRSPFPGPQPRLPPLPAPSFHLSPCVASTPHSRARSRLASACRTTGVSPGGQGSGSPVAVVLCLTPGATVSSASTAWWAPGPRGKCKP